MGPVILSAARSANPLVILSAARSAESKDPALRKPRLFGKVLQKCVPKYI